MIRPAVPEDAAAVAAVYAPAVRDGTGTFELDPPDVAEMAARMARVADVGAPWLVAERDGAVIGYAYAGPYHSRPAYRWTLETSVYIAPDARRTGTGTALLAALVAACEAGPWRRLLAVVGDADNAASIALHARHGFVHAGVLPAVGFKHGRWLDVVLMQRPLGPGATIPPAALPGGRA